MCEGLKNLALFALFASMCGKLEKSDRATRALIPCNNMKKIEAEELKQEKKKKSLILID